MRAKSAERKRSNQQEQLLQRLPYLSGHHLGMVSSKELVERDQRAQVERALKQV